MLPGVELDKSASGHEILNDQSEKQSHIYGWPKSFVNWLTSWANQKQLQSRSSGSLNWNKFAGAFGLSTIKTIKAIKETNPTHTLGMSLHDCTHPSCYLLMCGDFGKSLCCSLIEHDYHLQTAGFFLVHKISGAIPGSQDALIEVGEVLRLWPAVIAALPSLEPPFLHYNISTQCHFRLC